MRQSGDVARGFDRHVNRMSMNALPEANRLGALSTL
jgi:hypothetical protein